jgi:hypothetical protein
MILNPIALEGKKHKKPPKQQENGEGHGLD